jgi:hypothetical protein
VSAARVAIGPWGDSGELVRDDPFARARIAAAKQILGDRFMPTCERVIWNPTRGPWPPDVIEATTRLRGIWPQMDKLAQALIDSGVVL